MHRDTSTRPALRTSFHDLVSATNPCNGF